MTNKVYFIDIRSSKSRNIFEKVSSLLDHPEFSEKLQWDNLIPIKLHLGERSGWAYIHPKFVQSLVEKIKSKGGKPFLTDTNSVYIGGRSDAVDHLETAIQNGFSYSVVKAPIIIADGLKGENFSKVQVNLQHYQEVHLASLVTSAKKILCLSHFKGHELTGFGGALKNIGMGLASKAGKLSMHSTVSPYINKGCVGCGRCVSECPGKAIYLEDNRAWIDPEKCIGCAQCLPACPNKNIKIRWDESVQNVQEKICEHVYGVTKALNISVLFINFLINVTPDCDCCNHSDVPIVPNMGILASTDPVAIDQASVDLINSAEGIKRSALKKGFEKGGDKFRGIHAKADWEIQLDYGESIGLGKRKYELIEYE